MGFSEIVGQKPLIGEIKKQLEKEVLSHAYLIEGDEGLDPQGFARVFAKAVFCRGPKEQRPCGTCGPCKKMESGNHEDFITYSEERIKVDEIRALEKDLYIKPYGGGKKIYVIDHGEGITLQGQNALLKTLEEPPGFGMILLITNRREALLPTIQSRCQHMTLKPASEKELVKALEDRGFPHGDAQKASRIARGRIKTALSYLGDEDLSHRKEQLFRILGGLRDRDLIEQMQGLETLVTEKEECAVFFLQAREYFRDLLVFHETGMEEILFYPDEAPAYRRLAGEVDRSQIEKALEESMGMERMLEANVQLKALLEMFIMNTHRILKD